MSKSITPKSVSLVKLSPDLESVYREIEILESTVEKSSVAIVLATIAEGRRIQPVVWDANRKSRHSGITQKIGLELSTREKHIIGADGKVKILKGVLAFGKTTVDGYKSKLSKILVFASNGFDFDTDEFRGKYLGDVYAAINKLPGEKTPFWTKKASKAKVETIKHGTLGHAATEATYHLTAKPEQFVKALPHATQILLAIATLKALEIPVPKLLTEASKVKA